MENGCRTEKKYIISLAAAGALRERLSPLMQPDPQATCGTYRIRSLYFDTLDSDAFWEKAMDNVRRINEHTACKAQCFSLDDTDSLRREIEDSAMLVNATGCGFCQHPGRMCGVRRNPDNNFNSG